MTTITKPKCVNHFPRCVAIDIHIDETQSKNFKSAFFQRKDETFILSLTIDFGGEQEIAIPAGIRLGLEEGKATFGVKRAELEFELQGCEIPLDSVLLKSDLVKTEEIEHFIEELDKIGLSYKTHLIPTFSLEEKKSTKFKVLKALVEKVGSKTSPVWTFSAHTQNDYLSGSLTRCPLGKIFMDLSHESLLKGRVNVRGEDIVISWGKVLLTNDITNNKLAVIERAIALRHIKPMLNGPLSEVKWKNA